MANKIKMTVSEFAEIYSRWMINDADADDIRQAVAEFYGVGANDVELNTDDTLAINYVEE
jgi:hypothetical protein